MVRISKGTDGLYKPKNMSIAVRTGASMERALMQTPRSRFEIMSCMDMINDTMWKRVNASGGNRVFASGMC